MQLLTLKKRIHTILAEEPMTRDSDPLLLTYVWEDQAYEHNKERLATTSFGQFRALLLDGVLSPPESVRRMRQALQQHYPALRGRAYGKRHGHQESIKEELNAPELRPGGTP